MFGPLKQDGTGDFGKFTLADRVVGHGVGREV